jgi:predicted TIM-barrel fold metal-dependent hydrolase
MIIDMRCRPPLKEFLAYFEVERTVWTGKRVGARSVSKAFLAGSMELFMQEMDEAGIDAGVVLGRNSPEVFLGRKFNAAYIKNEVLAELQDRYPGRFIAFAGIDPTNTVHDAVDETERCIRKLGLKGIFLEPGRSLGTGPDDCRLFPIYEKCLELGVPVNVMSGPNAGLDIDASNPLYVDRVATRYPNLKIICGHGCYPYIQQIIGVAFKHPNVYISPDLYMFAPGGRDYVEATNGVLAQQFLFGSCYPFIPLAQAVEDTRKLGIDTSVLEAYLSGNALRVLGA